MERGAGRPVRLRVGGYHADSEALARLQMALRKDRRLNPDDVRRVVSKLDDVINELLAFTHTVEPEPLKSA